MIKMYSNHRKCHDHVLHGVRFEYVTGEEKINVGSYAGMADMLCRLGMVLQRPHIV